MKYLSFDQDELEAGASADFLRVASSHVKWWRCYKDFYVATNDEYPFLDRSKFESFESKIVNQLSYKSRLSELLLNYCNIMLKGNENVVIFEEQWNELDYLIEYEYRFIRLYWETGA